MNGYDSLVGQSFRRNGERYRIVECDGATVMAAVQRGGQLERVSVPLAEVLEALEVTEINLTELPRTREDASTA